MRRYFLLLILKRNIKCFGRILHLCLDTCSFPFIDIVHVAAEEAAVSDESYNSFVVLHNCSESGFGPRWKKKKKKNSILPGKGGPAKNKYTKSEILSAAEWLGLGLKGVICTIDRYCYYRERYSLAWVHYLPWVYSLAWVFLPFVHVIKF